MIYDPWFIVTLTCLIFIISLNRILVKSCSKERYNRHFVDSYEENDDYAEVYNQIYDLYDLY